MALPQSNEWLFQLDTQLLRAERKEQWLLLDDNCGDVNDNAVCTRNMEESGFSL